MPLLLYTESNHNHYGQLLHHSTTTASEQNTIHLCGGATDTSIAMEILVVRTG